MKVKKMVFVLVVVASVFALTGCSWYFGEGPAGFEMGIYQSNADSVEYDFRSNGEGRVQWDAPSSSDVDYIYDTFTWEAYTGNGRTDEIWVDYDELTDRAFRIITPTSFRESAYDGTVLGDDLYEKQWRLFAW